METENKINSSCWWVWRELCLARAEPQHQHCTHGSLQPNTAWTETPLCPGHHAGVKSSAVLALTRSRDTAGSSSGAGDSVSTAMGLSSSPLEHRGVLPPLVTRVSCHRGVLPCSKPSTDTTATSHPNLMLLLTLHPAPPSRPSIHPLPVPVPVPRVLVPAAVAGASLTRRSPNERGSSPGTSSISWQQT